MATTPATCVNHSDTPTRLSCSQCDAPICARCVRPSAVGQRCLSCAKPTSVPRAKGKPEHYVRAIGAGLSVAVLGGIVVTQIGFGALILSALVGFMVGRSVVWGTRGQTQPPFPVIAVVTAVGGLAIAFTLVSGTPVPGAGLRILAYPVAGWLATRGLYR